MSDFVIARGGCMWWLLAVWDDEGLVRREFVAASQDPLAIEAALRLLRGPRA